MTQSSMDLKQDSLKEYPSKQLKPMNDSTADDSNEVSAGTQGYDEPRYRKEMIAKRDEEGTED